MKTNFPFVSRRVPTVFCLVVLWFSSFARSARADTTDTNLFALGDQVIQFLDKRDAERFARAVTPTLDDWKESKPAVASLAGWDNPPGSELPKTLDWERKRVAESAEAFLKQASRVGLDLSKLHFRIKDIPAKTPGTTHHPGLQMQGQSLPYFGELSLILSAEPLEKVSGTNRFTGQYEVVLRGVVQFPGGWRCNGGIRWNRFPEGVSDPEMQFEMALLSKVESYKPITAADDPALSKFGETLARLVANRDVDAFVAAATPSFDQVWKRMEEQFKEMPESQRPSRAMFEKSWQVGRQGLTNQIQRLFAQVEHFGIDLGGADVKFSGATIQYANARKAGSLEDLTAQQIQVLLAVQSDHKNKAGVSITGEYGIELRQVVRMNGSWKVQGEFRWNKIPDGLLNEKDTADFAFENYVSEHRSLPPGTAAPEIEFIGLNDKAKSKLSDYRGKVVLLDFWATWCGPCQEPMARMQTYPASHPDWKNKVEYIALSIDDELNTAKQHMAKRGWTNTFNVWAGPGGWQSEPVKKFRVSGVPTFYIIDPQGKVAEAGHPAQFAERLAGVVTPLLPK